MKTMAYINIKGGVGKTTSAVNTAYNLSTMGYKVLMLDMDPQSNASDYFENENYGDNTLAAVLNGSCTIQEAIYPTKYDNLWIVPSTIELTRAEKEMIVNTQIPQQFQLSKHLEQVKDDFDYLVMDCGPAAETLLNINALVAADAVLIPLRPDKWTIKGLNMTIELIHNVKSYSARPVWFRAFMTQVENTVVHRAVFQQLKGELTDKVSDITIPKGTLLQAATYGEPLQILDPNNKASIAYMNLAKEIVTIMGDK